MNSAKINFTNTVKPTIGKFHGGIYPEEFKTLSSESPIQRLTTPEFLFLPIQQNIGIAGKIKVNVGDKVLQGALLVEQLTELGAHIHAPTNATIVAIGKHFIGHPSGMAQPAIKLQTSAEASKTSSVFTPLDWKLTPSDELLSRIQQAGIVGLGGATFPTHTKLAANNINTLIINAMECEPYITCDDRLLRENSLQVIHGALIAAKIIQAKKIIIAIEDNKSVAINQLEKTLGALTFDLPISIAVAPTKYPSGGEKQTIELVTGQQLPTNQLPASIGILVQNVATLYAVHEAVVKGIALTSRLITITGNQVKKAGNYWVSFGTSIQSIMQTLNISDCDSVVIGGPLMGQRISDYAVPVTKATNCLIFNSSAAANKKWLTEATEHQECIRCAECEKVCPAQLLPQQLYWFSQSDQWKNVENQGLFDCIECGACAYVCPSEIPLVHYYRYAKSNIKTIQHNNAIAEKAKQRFDFRETRLKRAKEERALKHKKAAEARKQAASDKSQDPSGKQQAINDALARVLQKKTQAIPPTEGE